MDIDKPQPDHENDLTALERRLATWRPAGGALDRDRMLFDAGCAAARADGCLWSWRLATAALVLVTVGLGGFLVHERSQRAALETALALRSGPPEPPPLPLLTQPSAIEPLAPSSYLVLTARFTAGLLETPALAAEVVDKPPGPTQTSPRPTTPLRVRDFQRVLDL